LAQYSWHSAIAARSSWRNVSSDQELQMRVRRQRKRSAEGQRIAAHPLVQQTGRP